MIDLIWAYGRVVMIRTPHTRTVSVLKDVITQFYQSVYTCYPKNVSHCDYASRYNDYIIRTSVCCSETIVEWWNRGSLLAILSGFSWMVVEGYSDLVQQICDENQTKGSVSDKSTKISRKLAEMILFKISYGPKLNKSKMAVIFKMTAKFKKKITKFYCDH